jgi:hypothetical protein
MEASENTGPSRRGDGDTDLRRIGPDRAAVALGSDRHAAGYSRLELMLTSILPRLVGEHPKPKTG